MISYALPTSLAFFLTIGSAASVIEASGTKLSAEQCCLVARDLASYHPGISLSLSAQEIAPMVLFRLHAGNTNLPAEKMSLQNAFRLISTGATTNCSRSHPQTNSEPSCGSCASSAARPTTCYASDRPAYEWVLAARPTSPPWRPGAATPRPPHFNALVAIALARIVRELESAISSPHTYSRTSLHRKQLFPARPRCRRGAAERRPAHRLLPRLPGQPPRHDQAGMHARRQKQRQ